MYVLCVQSSMEWFTPGKQYPADVVGSQILIRGDDAVSDLSPADSWLASRDTATNQVSVCVPFMSVSAEFTMADASP